MKNQPLRNTKNHLPRHAWKPCCKAMSVVSLASFDTCIVYTNQTAISRSYLLRLIIMLRFAVL